MIRFISLDQIRSKTERFMQSAMGTPCGDRMLLVEVGSPEEFDVWHIRRAIHFTPEQLAKAASDRRFTQASEVVLYGDNQPQVLAGIQALIEHGYLNLYYYPGGKLDWLEAGLWQQTSLVPADGFNWAGVPEGELEAKAA